MIAFPILPGIEINLFLLIFIALGAGVRHGTSDDHDYSVVYYSPALSTGEIYSNSDEVICIQSGPIREVKRLQLISR